MKLPEVHGKYRYQTKIKNWFDTGGPSEVLFLPSDLADLCAFLKQRDRDLPLTIIGAGSNVIISDSGIKGVTIRLPASFAEVEFDGDFVTAGAGALCRSVAAATAEAGFSGLEFMTGIPGSVGGAVAMNAGCYGSDVAATLVAATAVDENGNLVTLKNSDFGFYYRGSKLAKSLPKLIFAKAKFALTKSSASAVKQKIAELNQKRAEAQPIVAKTGGSTFKNPLNGSKAWELIDQAGARGLKVGDAQMSIKHCNFMINCGKATSEDLINLGNKVQEMVAAKTGVRLEWEIKILQ